MFADDTKRLIKFIEETPTCYHGVANISKVLRDNGYVELSEEREWDITPAASILCSATCHLLLRLPSPKENTAGL